MGDSELNSLATQIEFLIENQADFLQRLKQRLVLESNKVANPFTLVGKLLTNGLLSDGSNDSEASCGWKEMMVQSALMIACSKGVKATRGLMQALKESDNSALISALRTWVNEDLGIATVPGLSEPQEGDSALRSGTSKTLTKPMEITTEMSSVGTKFIDKVLSHVDEALMDQLQGHLLGKASRIANAAKFCSSLASQKVLDQTTVQLKAGPESEAQERIEKAIKAAFSKKAIASLVIAFEHSGNELILEESYEWLETSKIRRKNYPIAVKSLANQSMKEESKVVRCRDVTVKPTHGSSDDDETLYLCDRCEKNFTTDTSLNNHQLHCGQNDEADDTWSCRDLEVGWGDWKLKPNVCKVVVEQIEQVLLDGLERQGFVYVCPSTEDTDAGTQSTGRSGQHRQGHHGPKVKLSFSKHDKKFVAIGDNARGQKCSDCSKFFRSCDDLRLHITAVHGPSGKILSSPKIIKRNGKFGCSACKTVPPYLSRQGAEQHIIRVHTPSKLCPHCDGTFSSVSTLNRHISTKHLKTKRQAGFRRTLTVVK